MKNLSRAYNRYMQHVKFKKRVKKWFSTSHYNQVEEIKEALTGKGYTFLRTTARPCNCYMCSTYEKYKRTPKHKVMKEAFKE